MALDDDDRNKPKAINGSIYLVPKKKVDIDEGELEKAEIDLRKQAKQLYKNIEESYWDLGRCLYDVYDGVPGGYRDLMKGDGARANRKALFEKWGYTSFADYCEKEIGIRKRSAENVRYVYYYFEVNMTLPSGVKDRIKSLGRSKAYSLAGFVNLDNVIEWVDNAERMTHDELKKSITSAKRQAGPEGPGRPETAAAESEGEGETEEGDEVTHVPQPEEVHNLRCGLYESQWKTWQAAYDRASRASNSEKIGHNLELICQDFLMNNEWGTTPESDRLAMLAKYERFLGLKLIAIDPASGKPVHGADLLWMLVNERAKEEAAKPEKTKEEKTMDIVTNVDRLKVM